MRKVETEKEHKAILQRRTYTVLTIKLGSACAARERCTPHGAYDCCGVHRADALELGLTEYPRHLSLRDKG